MKIHIQRLISETSKSIDTNISSQLNKTTSYKYKAISDKTTTIKHVGQEQQEESGKLAGERE